VGKLDFVPHDQKTIHQMLEIIGFKTIEDLFQDIPKDLILQKLKLSPGLSEADLINKLREISKKSKIYNGFFLGAGCYYHYIPSLVDFIINRSEFYTSYTPYQAEASQGFLQAIYEYQTIITHLTMMDVANASMYDGSTALAEAALMATLITRKNKILMIEGIHPEYIEVVKTYCWGQEIISEIIPLKSLEAKLNDEFAAILIQSPNFFGEIEDLEAIVKNVKSKFPKCLIIHVMTDPTCLGVLRPPGELDIDIFVAEGQSFGISPSFGGPGLGIFTTKKEFLRKIPGRLVGKTKEINGDKEGFILTLQAREQHIRREKASSNICTNQALCSLSALIYLLCMGRTGLKNIALQNIQKTHYVKNKISNIPGYKILNTKPTYNEFLVECPDIDRFINKCEEMNLLAPLKLSKYFAHMKDVALVCITEMNSRESIDLFIQAAQLASSNTEED
jgi:glycine dehydrogenase subunit 1